MNEFYKDENSFTNKEDNDKIKSDKLQTVVSNTIANLRKNKENANRIIGNVISKNRGTVTSLWDENQNQKQKKAPENNSPVYTSSSENKKATYLPYKPADEVSKLTNPSIKIQGSGKTEENIKTTGIYNASYESKIKKLIDGLNSIYNNENKKYDIPESKPLNMVDVNEGLEKKSLLNADSYNYVYSKTSQSDKNQDKETKYTYNERERNVVNTTSRGVLKQNVERVVRKQNADNVIKENAELIKKAAEKFGVNPGILGAIIYTEQLYNVDKRDLYTDAIGGYIGVDTSIGIAQVKGSTAKMLEKMGYMPEIKNNKNNGIAGFLGGDEQIQRTKALQDPETNIEYAAAYIKYFQDRWEEAYPEIDGRTAILATLYNQGERFEPHSNPSPNPFGSLAKYHYHYVRKLLGLL